MRVGYFTCKCPGCPHTDETMDHLFQCPNKSLLQTRTSLLTSLRSSGLKQGWPRAVLDAIIQLLQAQLDASEPTLPSHPQIRRAVESQIQIGIHLLPRRFISRHWITVLEEFQVKFPRAKITSLLRSIWIDFSDGIWRARNELVHRRENEHRLASSKNYNSKLLWFLENTHVIP